MDDDVASATVVFESDWPCHALKGSLVQGMNKGLLPRLVSGKEGTVYLCTILTDCLGNNGKMQKRLATTTTHLAQPNSIKKIHTEKTAFPVVLFFCSLVPLSLFFHSGSTNKKSKYELITKDELHFALATLLDTSDA